MSEGDKVKDEYATGKVKGKGTGRRTRSETEMTDNRESSKRVRNDQVAGKRAPEIGPSESTSKKETRKRPERDQQEKEQNKV